MVSMTVTKWGVRRGVGSDNRVRWGIWCGPMQRHGLRKGSVVVGHWRGNGMKENVWFRRECLGQEREATRFLKVRVSREEYNITEQQEDKHNLLEFEKENET